MLSPWSKMRSAPAGSSVKAHGRTIAYGIPLSRIRSSPCSQKKKESIKSCEKWVSQESIKRETDKPLACRWEWNQAPCLISRQEVVCLGPNQVSLVWLHPQSQHEQTCCNPTQSQFRVKKRVLSCKEQETKLNLGVRGSSMYARMLERGSSNSPSLKVGLSLPSYSNLLNISWTLEKKMQLGLNVTSMISQIVTNLC